MSKHVARLDVNLTVSRTFVNDDQVCLFTQHNEMPQINYCHFLLG